VSQALKLSSQAQASQAQASQAVVQSTGDLNNPSVSISSAATKLLSTLITTQVRALMSTGSYIPANSLLMRTLDEIRQSTAFKANNTVAANAVSSLMSLEQELQTYVSSSASAAQASQAQSSFVSGLTSSSVQASSTAAAGLANTVTAQIEYLLAIGSYADATNLVTTTLQQLRDSTAFKAGDPTVIDLIAKLTVFDIKTISENPTTTASAAAASSAQAVAATGLASKNVTISSNAATSMSNAVTSQVQYLTATGEYSAAISLLTKTLEQIRSSTAFMSGDPTTVAIVTTLTQQIRDANARMYTSTGAQAASAATASSANAAQVTGLTSSSVSTSSSSAVALVSATTSQANYLIATGDYAAAKALVTATLQQLRSSTAFKAGDPTVLSLIATLNSLANNSVQWNPNTTASAATASAALSTSVSSLFSSSVQTSSNAATNILNTVSAQIEYLTATGDYSAATALLTSTLAQLRNSTAFLANDPNTVLIVDGLSQLNNRAASLNPNTTASAAAASAATVSNTAALTSTNITTSSNAATALGATVQRQIDFLTSTGDYNAADSILENTLAALRASPAFMAGDPSTVAIVNKLTQLEIKVDSLKPGAAASAAAASAAIATSVAALTSPSVSGSVVAATTLGANIISQVNSLLTIGSYSAAAGLLTTTLQDLRNSTAFKSGDPTVIALVNQLVTLEQKSIKSDPTITASAATASAANSAATTGLSSTNVATSSTSAVTLGKNIQAQMQQLIGTGDYAGAIALGTSTLQNIRASPAFLAGDPATVAMVATLTALEQSAVSTNPGTTASAAAASAAVTTSVAALSSSSVASSASAAILLSNTIFTDATNLLSLGSYAAAADELLKVMTQLRDSTAFKAGEPSVTAAVNRLATLYQQTVQINPGTSASAAAASAATASSISGLASTNVQTSSTYAATLAATIQSQIDFLTSTGNSVGAVALIGPTLVSLRTSTAFLAGDSATVALVNKLTQLQLTLLANNPAVTASAAAASAAIASSVSALSSSNVTTSVAAATSLGQTVLNLVNSYTSVGSYSSAVALLSVTLQELRDSTAFKAGDSSVIALVNQLVALQQKSVSGNPAAAASAAAASAAQSGAVAALSSRDPAVSSKAVTTLVSTIVNNIQAIIDIGANGSTQEAKALATTTLENIHGSPAFLAGDPAAVAAVNQLTTLLNTIIQKDPTTTASAAVASAAMAADVAALSSISVLTSNIAAISLGNTTLAQAHTLFASGSYAAAQAAIMSAMTSIRESTAFKAGEPAVLAMQQQLAALYQQTVQSNPASTASAAAASAAAVSNTAALSSSNIATSSKAAVALGASVQTQIDLLTSTGDYTGAAAIIGPFLIFLRSSPAFMGGDPATVALVEKLTQVELNVLAQQPGAAASSAAVSAAVATSVAGLTSTDVASSAGAATTLSANIIPQVVVFLTTGNYSGAASILIATLQQIRASTAFKAGDPTVTAIVAQLVALQEKSVAGNPATTASAAKASAVVAAAANNLASTDISKSSAAAVSLTSSVSANATQLMSVGNYAAAEAQVEATLIQLRASSAFAANDPVTLAAIAQLVAFETLIISSNPSATASAAAASAATSTAAGLLKGTDMAASAAAVTTIVQTTLTQITHFLSTGDYASANSLLQTTIEQLRNSTAAIANDPGAAANIAKLTASLQTVISSNPGTTASAAAQSSAQAGLQTSLANTDVATSAAAAASLVGILNANVANTTSLGDFASAQSLIATTLQQIMKSTAYAASDPATLALVATLQNQMLNVANQNPASRIAQNTASAAQSYYMSALQGTNLPASVQAASNLATSVTTSVNSLMGTGAYTVASQLINQSLQAIYFSTAYLSGDPAILQTVKTLTALLQTANASLPPSIATASAAAASAAQVGYMSNLKNTDPNASAQACLSLGISVIGTVNTLLSIGSNQVAYSILQNIIASISTSTAVSSGNAQVLSLLKTLTAMQATIPQLQATGTQLEQPPAVPQPTQATAPPPAENVFSLSENSEKGYGYGDGYGKGYGYAKGGSRKAKKATNKTRRRSKKI